MTNPVKIKRSNVPAKIPTVEQLQAGELAMNTADGKMFFSTGTAVKALANGEDLSWLNVTGLGQTNGLVVNRNGVPAPTALFGTVNQVVVSNGDAAAGNPSIALAQNVVLPGNGGVTLPTGDTAQRTGADGTLRYSTTMLALEALINGTWETINSGPSDLAAVQIRRTTTQALNTTWTEVTFNTVDLANNPNVVDRGVVTSRVEIKQTGLYLVGFECESRNTTNANLDRFQMRVNGADLPNGLVIINCRAGTQHVAKYLPLQLSAGDYVTVAASSNTGTSGTMQIGATLTAIRLQGLQGPAGPAGGQSSLYYPAATLDNPNNGNWAVNALAPVTPDTANASLNVRAFDGTAEEGVGCTIYIPPTASSLTVTLMAKAATAPSTAKSAMLNLYRRLVPIGSAVPAWSSAFALNAMAVPTNVHYQSYAQTISLATLGMLAGQTYQLELTRNGASASDTLAGDLQLLQLTITFA